MAKKEKKEKGKKKNSSSFFSNLNTDSTIEYGFAQKNPKSKWAKWIIAGLVVGVTATGVAVPWAMSSCTLTINKPYADDRIMYTYIDPITKKEISVTYEEFANRINTIKPQATILEKWDEVFYNSVLKDLYNEEREAFLKFKAIYKKLHDGEPTISNFGADLSSSYEDIEKEQKEILEKNKKTFQKATDGSSWQEKWIKELQTNSIYGPQKSDSGVTALQLEKKALEYMVSEKIKTASLSRYNGVSIQTSNWTATDLNFANTPSPSSTETYTTYKDNEGKEKQITVKEAVDIWSAYLTQVKVLSSGDADDSVGANVITYKDSNEKIAVFESKSYCVDYRNPLRNDRLLNIMNSNFKFGLVSSFSLGISLGESNSLAFSINLDTLKKFFSVKEERGVIDKFVPFSQISNFKGATTISTSNDNKSNANYIQNSKDALLIKTFSEDSSSTLGSSKIVRTNTLISSSNSSSSSDSSDSSSSSSDSSINMVNLSALLSSDAGITSLDPSNSLFSISEINPLTTFANILMNINVSTNAIDFTSASWVEENWDRINYGKKSVSAAMVHLVKLLKENIDSNTYEYKGTISTNNYNQLLENALSNLGEDDFSLLGKLFNCIMVGKNKNVSINYSNNISDLDKIGYWTLYKLSEGTYMHLSSSTITIFSKNFEEITLQKLRQMVVSDLNQTVNNNSSSSTEESTREKSDSSKNTREDSSTESSSSSLYYDVASMFSNINDSNLIILSLLEEPTNQEKFKEAIKVYKNDDSEVDKIYNEFYQAVNIKFETTVNTSISSIISNVSETLTTLIDSKKFYDFATVVSDNGEELVAFQTQTKFGNDSLVKGKDKIDELFIQNIENVLLVDRTTRKGGK